MNGWIIIDQILGNGLQYGKHLQKYPLGSDQISSLSEWERLRMGREDLLVYLDPSLDWLVYRRFEASKGLVLVLIYGHHGIKENFLKISMEWDSLVGLLSLPQSDVANRPFSYSSAYTSFYGSGDVWSSRNINKSLNVKLIWRRIGRQSRRSTVNKAEYTVVACGSLFALKWF